MRKTRIQSEGEPDKEVAGMKTPKMRKIGEAEYVSTKAEIKKVQKLAKRQIIGDR